MSSLTQNINRIEADYDVNKKGTIIDPGPYEAEIMNANDVLRTGRVQVYIPSMPMGPKNDVGSWLPVRYATPYYGKTSKNFIGKNESEGVYSYGMWMTVPDVGVRVIVTFLEGNRDNGVVIGCIIDDITNHMVPGLPSSKYWIKTPEVAEIFPSAEPGKDFMPVLEHNPKVVQENRPLPQKYARPVNIELAKILKEQGLIGDVIRGQSFSTAQRENNSAVFGVSTPGRAEESLAAIKSKGDNITQDDLDVKKRLPGHMFVMDDGDIEGDSNLIRLRTSTGHQILMNDTEGIIYVATASGNAWIEMTNNGDVMMYNKGNFSIHCEGSFNVHAGANINMEATKGINVSAMEEGGIKMQAADGRYEVYSEKGTYNQSNGPFHVKTTGSNITMTSEDADIHMNGPTAGDATKPTRNDLLTNNGNRDVLNSTSTVVPEHEPYNRGTE